MRTRTHLHSLMHKRTYTCVCIAFCTHEHVDVHVFALFDAQTSTRTHLHSLMHTRAQACICTSIPHLQRNSLFSSDSRSLKNLRKQRLFTIYGYNQSKLACISSCKILQRFNSPKTITKWLHILQNLLKWLEIY